MAAWCGLWDCQQQGRKAPKISESVALIRESIIERHGQIEYSGGYAGSGVCRAPG